LGPIPNPQSPIPIHENECNTIFKLINLNSIIYGIEFNKETFNKIKSNSNRNNNAYCSNT
jgi:hypothetical protein